LLLFGVFLLLFLLFIIKFDWYWNIWIIM
jgi:hypothetical protein